MMALGGVLGFNVADNAAFLSAYNVPRGVVSVLAEPILRRVPAQVLAAGGLLSAACGVAWLAALGERAHDTFQRDGSSAFVSATGSRALAPSYVSAAALGLGVVCVHVSLPVLLAQAAAKPRHGARYGAAFGLSAVMAKARGGGRHGPRGGCGGARRIHSRLRRHRRGVARGSRRGGGCGQELAVGVREVERYVV